MWSMIVFSIFMIVFDDDYNDEIEPKKNQIYPHMRHCILIYVLNMVYEIK